MTETEKLDRYIAQHIDPEGDYLYRLYRATNVQLLRGRMASGHLQGRLLKMLVKMIEPPRPPEMMCGTAALTVFHTPERLTSIMSFQSASLVRSSV